MKHLFKILTGVFFVSTIVFLILFVRSNNTESDTQDKYDICLEEVVTLSKSYDDAIELWEAFLKFTKSTNLYIDCLWSWMRGEDINCNDWYSIYKEGWNTLYEYELVETYIYDA